MRSLLLLLLIGLFFLMTAEGQARAPRGGRIQPDHFDLSAGCLTESQALYWRPTRFDLDYAMAVDLSGLSGTLLEVQPGFDLGFESALGYRNAAGIEFLSRYIHLDAKAHESATNDNRTLWNRRAAADNLLAGPITFAEGEYRLRYDVADLDLACLIPCQHVWLLRPFMGFRYLELEQSLSVHYVTSGTAEVDEEQHTKGYGAHGGIDLMLHCGKGSSLVAGTAFNLYYAQSDVRYVNSGDVLATIGLKKEWEHPLFGWEFYTGIAFNWRRLDLEIGYQMTHLLQACSHFREVDFSATGASLMALSRRDLLLDGAYFKANLTF